jgi:serine/threonine protein kinase
MQIVPSTSRWEVPAEKVAIVLTVVTFIINLISVFVGLRGSVRTHSDDELHQHARNWYLASVVVPRVLNAMFIARTIEREQRDHPRFGVWLHRNMQAVSIVALLACLRLDNFALLKSKGTGRQLFASPPPMSTAAVNRSKAFGIVSTLCGDFPQLIISAVFLLHGDSWGFVDGANLTQVIISTASLLHQLILRGFAFILVSAPNTEQQLLDQTSETGQPLLEEADANDADHTAGLVDSLERFKDTSRRQRRAMQHRVFGFTIVLALVAICLWRLTDPTVPHYAAISLAWTLLLVPYTICPMMVIDRGEFQSGNLIRLLGVFYLLMAFYWIGVDGNLSCTHNPTCRLGVKSTFWHEACVDAEGASNVPLAALALVRFNDTDRRIRLFFVFQMIKLLVLAVFMACWVVHFATIDPIDWYAVASTGFTCIVYSVLCVDVLVRPYRFRGVVLRVFRSRQKLRDGVFMATVMDCTSGVSVNDEHWVHRLDSNGSRVHDGKFPDETQHERYWDQGTVISVVSRPRQPDEFEPRVHPWDTPNVQEFSVSYVSSVSGKTEISQGSVAVSPVHLDRAVATLRCVNFNDLSAELLNPDKTPHADLYALSQPCIPGEIDFYVSHSWHDSHFDRFSALSSLAQRFFSNHGRYPRLWIDRACAKPETTGATCSRLQLSPMVIKLSNEVAFVIGPTYFARLWAVWELYSTLLLAGESVNAAGHRVQVMSITGMRSMRTALDTFDAANLRCYNPNEETQLFSVFSTCRRDFNQQVRSFGPILDELQQLQQVAEVANFKTASTLGQLVCALLPQSAGTTIPRDEVIAAIISAQGTAAVRSASDAEISRCAAVAMTTAQTGGGRSQDGGNDLGALGIHHFLLGLGLPRSHERRLREQGGWASIADLQSDVHGMDEMAEQAGLPVGHSRKLFRAVMERKGNSSAFLADFLRESCSTADNSRFSTLSENHNSRFSTLSECPDFRVLSAMKGSYIPFEQLIMGPQLGKGAAGTVYACHFGSGAIRAALAGGAAEKQKAVPSNAAVKKIAIDVTESEMAAIEMEVRILTQIRHPSVVTFIGISQTPEHDLLIVTELCMGDLMQLLQTRPVYRGCNDTSQFISSVEQIAAGMAYLHDKGICHRDLKPQNVLVKIAKQAGGEAGPGEVVCKLCDFGVSSIIDCTSSGSSIAEARVQTICVGSLVYMAPEVCEGKGGKAEYAGSVDVFSFGIMLWVLWYGGKDPYGHFPDYGEMKLRRHIADGGRPLFPIDSGGVGNAGDGGSETGGGGQNRTSIGSSCSGGGGGGSSSGCCMAGSMVQKVAALAARCWSGVPTERPSFDEALVQLQVLSEECLVPPVSSNTGGQ